MIKDFRTAHAPHASIATQASMRFAGFSCAARPTRLMGGARGPHLLVLGAVEIGFRVRASVHSAPARPGSRAPSRWSQSAASAPGHPRTAASAAARPRCCTAAAQDAPPPPPATAQRCSQGADHSRESRASRTSRLHRHQRPLSRPCPNIALVILSRNGTAAIVYRPRLGI